MITQLKSTKQVSTDIMNPDVKNTIFCQIDLFQLDENGIRVNGKYIYKTEIPKVNEEDEQTYSETIVKQFSKEFTVEEVNQLFFALNVKHTDATPFFTRRTTELEKGLQYIINAESMFGLTGQDWE
jgi:hypothetical protein